MKRYKLTDQNMCTYNNTQWEIGIKKTTSGKGELGSGGWLHCYSCPLLALLLNPAHGNIKNPKLFLCETAGNHKYDNGVQEGSTIMHLIEELSIPNINLVQTIAFSILCALEVYKEPSFVKWANNWLQNIDRTKSIFEIHANINNIIESNSETNAANSAIEAASFPADTNIAIIVAQAAFDTIDSIDIDLIKIAKEAMKIT